MLQRVQGQPRICSKPLSQKQNKEGGREDRGGVLGLGEGRGECNFYTEQLLLKFPVALHPQSDSRHLSSRGASGNR